MADNENTIPEDLWLVKTPDGPVPCTPADALNLLASLAYDGALPGASAEVWVWDSSGWQRGEQPYLEDDGTGG